MLNKGKKTYSENAVYELLLKIPKGRVTTYGDIARALGNGALARSVGNALHKNPDGDKFPCYKVVNCRGLLSPNYAFGGLDEQKRRLEAEGIVVNNFGVDLEIFGFSFVGKTEEDII
ncbi:MAG: MGMT family protein [Oscillospiraceae bacterium]|nr:MGMT family protein [Oscillospiraceae bacterium]